MTFPEAVSMSRVSPDFPVWPEAARSWEPSALNSRWLTLPGAAMRFPPGRISMILWRAEAERRPLVAEAWAVMVFAGAAVMAMSGSVTSVRIETSAFLGPGAPAAIHRSMVRISFAEG